MDEKVKQLMDALQCSEEEARQLIADDEAIDKGEKLFELSAEEKKVAKAMVSTGTKKRTTTTTKRERKPDDEKQEIISKIADFLSACDGYDVEVIKKEREISLLIGANDYSITLTKHRPPKK